MPFLVSSRQAPPRPLRHTTIVLHGYVAVVQLCMYGSLAHDCWMDDRSASRRRRWASAMRRPARTAGGRSDCPSRRRRWKSIALEDSKVHHRQFYAPSAGWALDTVLLCVGMSLRAAPKIVVDIL